MQKTQSLNLRDVPVGLVVALKKEAIDKNTTLRKLALSLLTRSTLK